MFEYQDKETGAVKMMNTADEVIPIVLERLDKIEKQLKAEIYVSSANMRTKAEVDRNEFDSDSFDQCPEMTVSPSNYKKLKDVPNNGYIKIFCSDNDKEGILLRVVDCFIVLDDHKNNEVEKDNNNGGKSQRKDSGKSRNKRCRGKYKISTQKNSFPDLREKKKTPREAAIEKGLIIPEKENTHKKHTYNKNVARWRSNSGINRSYE